MVDLSDNVLTTLATAKEDLGISGSSEDDKLTRLINVASDAIEGYCDRSFYRVTDQADTVGAFSTPYLSVTRTPVNSLTGITFDGVSLDLTKVTVDFPGCGLIARPGGWSSTAHRANDISRGLLPGTERLLYVATYDGGWYTPKQEDDTPANTRALPWDLEDACVELVREIYKAKGRDPGIKSEKLSLWSVTYGTSGSVVSSDSNSWPIAVRRSLNRYRRLS